jgi:hypothetical protein
MIIRIGTLMIDIKELFDSLKSQITTHKSQINNKS